jgi:hypothetical protein
MKTVDEQVAIMNTYTICYCQRNRSLRIFFISEESFLALQVPDDLILRNASITAEGASFLCW